MTDIFSRINELRDQEVKLFGRWTTQANHGMHRQCELDLLGKIASDIGAAQYVELGCGVGHGMVAVKRASPSTALVGYERHSGEPIDKTLNIIRIDIFTHGTDLASHEFTTSITEYVNQRPLFVYTDNGNKLAELLIMSAWIRPGDILGTHDWPNEVRTEQFLLDRGFTVCEEYEPYIAEHLSLQRFWRRT